MTYIMVDVEADGPIPGEYSMVSFGAIVVEESLDNTFYSTIKPISSNWIPEALAVSGFTRDQTLKFADPKSEMERFESWIKTIKKPMFVSDNNGFDWGFVNWYFHKFLGRNPFGHSSTNLGSLYKGMQKSAFVNFKHLRKTSHTHNALDDAKGNAEAMLSMIKSGLKV